MGIEGAFLFVAVINTAAGVITLQWRFQFSHCLKLCHKRIKNCFFRVDSNAVNWFNQAFELIMWLALYLIWFKDKLKKRCENWYSHSINVSVYVYVWFVVWYGLRDTKGAVHPRSPVRWEKRVRLFAPPPFGVKSQLRFSWKQAIWIRASFYIRFKRHFSICRFRFIDAVFFQFTCIWFLLWSD